MAALGNVYRFRWNTAKKQRRKNEESIGKMVKRQFNNRIETRKLSRRTKIMKNGTHKARKRKFRTVSLGSHIKTEEKHRNE